MARASIFGKGVGFKDIAPDLAAEGDVSFLTVHFLQLLFSLALLEENHARFENLHGCGPVRVLGTLILTLDYNPRWNMSYPNGRISFIHMLASSATGSISINS